MELSTNGHCASSLYSFKKRLKFPLTIQLLSLLVLAHYSLFAIFSLFVSGSLCISNMARWLHPCIYIFTLMVLYRMLIRFFKVVIMFIESQPHMPLADMPVIIFIESWIYFFQDRLCNTII